MRHAIKRALCIYCLFLIGSSCTNELLDTKSVLEGETAMIQVQFSSLVPNSVVISRAAGAETEENKINDLYLMIFDSRGVREELSQSVFPLTASSGTLTSISVLSGRKYICAIGNVNDNTYSNITREMLDGIRSVEELNNLKIKLLENTVSRIRGNLLMFGDAGESVDIAPGRATSRIHIPMRRLVAKIRFEFRTGSKAGKAIKFIPRAYRIVNNPKTCYLKEHISPMKDGAVTEEDFFHSAEAWDENDKHWSREFDVDADGKYSFTYFQYENRKQSKKPITTYAQRAMQEKTPVAGVEKPSVKNGTFTYAPDLATYVEVLGDYSEEDISDPDNQLRRFANVKYILHLGYAENNAGDFNVRRNIFYIYQITVNGVNDIVMEAQEVDPDKENDPRSEGTVIDAIRAYKADAHYETFKMIFKKSDFYAEEGNIKGDGKIYATLSDPFSTTTVVNGEAKAKVPEWLRFSVNLTGLELFGDGKMISYTNTLNYKKNRPDIASTQLMNIQELVNYLSNPDNFNGLSGNDEISVSAFLDEYYYADKPVESFVNAPNRDFRIYTKNDISPDGASMYMSPVWSVSQVSIASFYKNGKSGFGLEMEDEQGVGAWYGYLGILNSDFKNLDSYNGRYNTLMMYRYILGQPGANANWKSALGTATTVVQGGVAVPQMNPNVNVNRGWGTKGSWYQGRAYYGCLARNRDENGDGIINPSEIKWYIPSAEQLTELVMGQAGYDSHYRFLRLKNITVNGDNNIYSSTANPLTASIAQTFNTFVMLADLYNSICRDDDIAYWFRDPKKKGRTYCVRNYGIPDPGIDEPVPNFNSYDYDNLRTYPMPPHPLDIKDGNGNSISFSAGKIDIHNGIVIFPSSMEERTLRQEIFKRGELPLHYYNNKAINSIYKKGFRLGTKKVSSMTLSQLHNGLNSGQSPCANYVENGISGWRLPNAAELSAIAIMVHRYATSQTSDYNLTFNENHDYPASTVHPYPVNWGRKYYKAVRMGAYTPGYLELGADGDKIMVRCVKDYDEK